MRTKAGRQRAGPLRQGGGRRRRHRLEGAAANGDVAKGAALGPVAVAGLAEVAGLGEVLVESQLGQGSASACGGGGGWCRLAPPSAAATET
ncbi:hypothetical protein NL676_005471 [Syzygium grande]|nr:hypothetical protein NL676_005471 [Syzygium grande]